MKKNNKRLKRLKELDEMVADYNTSLFHLHLFGEFNEFELSKLDLWFNNPAMDHLCSD